MGSSTREVLRCLLEGLRWLWGADAVKVAGKSGISQARSRLGEMPLHWLYEQVVQPVATRATKGAWYRTWWLVSLDGSSLDVADTDENCESAFPQLRFVALVENGTHVLFGTRLGGCADGETTLAHDVVSAFRPSMLCLADRQFFGHAPGRITSPADDHATSTHASRYTYLKNGGTLEKAAAMTNHASTRTTQLYDQRHDAMSLDEVERMRV